MSNTKQVAKKKVTKRIGIKESELVDLIDNIVTEAVAVKKQEWINENKKTEAGKTAILEGKINSLEAKFKELTEGKK
jgi:hypothetical protein